MEKLLQEYQDHQKKLEILSNISGLLTRDQRVNLPSKAVTTRSEQRGYISGLRHQYEVDEKYASTIAQLSEQSSKLSVAQRRSVYLAKRSIDIQRALPQEFVEKFTKVETTANEAWAQAKNDNNYQLFAPHLEQIIDCAKRYAEYIAPNTNPYDVRLDQYEEGMTEKEYDRILLPLEEKIKAIIQKLPIREKDQPYLIQNYDKKTCLELLQELTQTLGFDHNAGIISASNGAFAEYLGPHDKRITTGFNDLLKSIYSIIHETGHGLYDQNGNGEYNRSNIACNPSLGMHESQSRLLENIIGKDKPFLTYLLTLLRKYFPQQTLGFTLDGLYSYMTQVHPSFIRIQADEVTYNLHVLARYEIEKGLMNGSIHVKDVPHVRNEKMKVLLGILPPTDTEGCLQDVHWSLGLIGYFPTYVLGNIISAQLRNTFLKTHPTVAQEFALGNFSSFFKRFKEHVWQYGGLYKAPEHVLQITQEPINPSYFDDYLTQKYTTK